VFFFSSRRRHTRFSRDWSSDVCSSDLGQVQWGPWGADVGHEAVEIAVHLVLGEVDVAVDRVHRRGLMLEYPQRRAGNGRAQALRSEERRVGKEERARGVTDGER